MSEHGFFQIVFYFFILLALVKPLGWYMAKVYDDPNWRVLNYFRPFERFIYRVCVIDPKQKMNWHTYLLAMLMFNFMGFCFVYGIQRLQFYLPFNPQQLTSPSVDLAFNTAVSFITNTNWQSYSGENTMSYYTQMAGLTVQNFLSAATGMALLIALIRGIRGRETFNLGNFWVDTTRGILYILLPLSIIFSLFLVSQGVIQNLKPNQLVTLIQPYNYQDSVATSHQITSQVIPMGPVASQIAIKQLGTNGGGFFNVNSAHPFENPTPVTNFFEMLAILLIPAALCYTFGMMINDRRQGLAILIAMLILFLPPFFFGLSCRA